MPIISGTVEILLVAAVLVTAVAAWLVRRRRYPGPRIHGEEGIERDELEAAEREVRDLDPSLRPDEERLG
ncbi:MAG: hypothetical protein ACREMG_13380, partial [Gemmatimonadales bacterium]